MRTYIICSFVRVDVALSHDQCTTILFMHYVLGKFIPANQLIASS